MLLPSCLGLNISVCVLLLYVYGLCKQAEKMHSNEGQQLWGPTATQQEVWRKKKFVIPGNSLFSDAKLAVKSPVLCWWPVSDV